MGKTNQKKNTSPSAIELEKQNKSDQMFLKKWTVDVEINDK